MKLSTRARYALRMMTALVRAADEDTRRRRGARTSGAVSLGEIARRTDISRRYLDQVVIGLKHHGLLRGRSGRDGGYELASPPSTVTALAVVESAIGPINIVDCVRRPEICLKADVCECRFLYALINDSILRVLGDITLADLCNERWFRAISRQHGQTDTRGHGPARHCRAQRSSHVCRKEDRSDNGEASPGRHHTRRRRRHGVLRPT